MSLNHKLEAVGRYANGLFITGQFVSTANEKDHLSIMKRRRPEFFTEIFKSRTKKRYPLILQLSQKFCNKHATGAVIEGVKNRWEAYKLLAWSGVVTDWKYHQAIPDKVFQHNNQLIFLDTFDSDIFGLDGGNVLTLPFRETELHQYGLNPVITPSFIKYKTKGLLYEFYTSDWRPDEVSPINFEAAFLKQKDGLAEDANSQRLTYQDELEQYIRVEDL